MVLSSKKWYCPKRSGTVPARNGTADNWNRLHACISSLVAFATRHVQQFSALHYVAITLTVGILREEKQMKIHRL